MAALVSIGITAGAGVVLAVLLGLMRFMLAIRDTVRDTKSLTAAVAELRKDQTDDRERLVAVERELARQGGQHRREGRQRDGWFW